MQVGFRDLTVWSFLMASAHGAGFMVLPFVMPHAGGAGGSRPRARVARGRRGERVATSAATGRRRSHAGVSRGDGLVAWVVYRKLGLGVLRKAWFNLDWLWAGALVVTGVVVLLK